MIDVHVGLLVQVAVVAVNSYPEAVIEKILVLQALGTATGDIAVDEDVLRIGFIENDKLCAVSTSGVHTVN